MDVESEIRTRTHSEEINGLPRLISVHHLVRTHIGGPINRVIVGKLGGGKDRVPILEWLLIKQELGGGKDRVPISIMVTHQAMQKGA